MKIITVAPWPQILVNAIGFGLGIYWFGWWFIFPALICSFSLSK